MVQVSEVLGLTLWGARIVSFPLDFKLSSLSCLPEEAMELFLGSQALKEIDFRFSRFIRFKVTVGMVMYGLCDEDKLETLVRTARDGAVLQHEVPVGGALELVTVLDEQLFSVVVDLTPSTLGFEVFP